MRCQEMLKQVYNDSAIVLIALLQPLFVECHRVPPLQSKYKGFPVKILWEQKAKHKDFGETVAEKGRYLCFYCGCP